jgi:hypothetical protein
MGRQVYQNDVTLLLLNAVVDDRRWGLQLLGPADETQGQEGKRQKRMMADLAHLASETMIVGHQLAGQEYVGRVPLRSQRHGAPPSGLINYHDSKAFARH